MPFYLMGLTSYFFNAKKVFLVILNGNFKNEISLTFWQIKVIQINTKIQTSHKFLS